MHGVARIVTVNRDLFPENSGDIFNPTSQQHLTIANVTPSKIALQLFSRLPLRLNHAAGWLLGNTVHSFPNRQSKIIRRNLEVCFPQASPAEQRRLTRRNMIQTGKNLTELAAFWHWPKSRIEALVVEEVNRAILDEAIARKKGVIIAAPHAGAWELIGLKLTCEHPMHFLYRPNKKPHRDKTFIAARERFGGKCHPITPRGLATLVKALKRGEMIGILPDQEPAQDHGVFAPLFNVPAYTMTFMTSLARRTEAPVVFAMMERLPKGRGYRLHYLQPDDKIYAEDPTVSSRELNACVERCIAIAPSQYMWNYKRFRKVPEGSKPLYSRLQT